MFTVYLLLALLVVGHLVQIAFARDDWPFSSYPMYAFRLADRKRNPFLPFREKHARYAGGFIVLTAVFPDGKREPLTTSFEHPLLYPFDRIRIVRQLATLNREGRDPEPVLEDVGRWITTRSRLLGYAEPPSSLELSLYLWERLPEDPMRNHPPDRVEIICEHPIEFRLKNQNA